MRAFWTAAILVSGLAALDAAASDTTLRGYTVVDSARQHLLESQFIDIPSAQGALETATALGARPHYAGTPADHDLALFMRDRLRSFGIAAELEPLTVRVDTPRELVLELAPPAELVPATGRSRHHERHAAFPVALDLSEVADPTDPATAARTIGLPFNAGSADGDISAPLVYVDRGLDADYDTLAAARVDVRGAVVIVRYGAQFRGRLAERAQTRGAAGVLFYSDPRDDGFARGAVYPDGPWRPLAAVERGWVGTGVHIPTLPISAANAQILLASLHGTPGPSAWGGALPVEYPLARGPGRVHLIVKLNRKQTLLWNTIGSVPGLHGDQSIVLGAQRDAWVYGVGENGAGVATLLEVARGIGFLLQSGWRPQRTIVIAGWDGEELGQAGSHAYAARHRTDIERGCFAYLDADENVTGTAFGAEAAVAIAPLVVDAARAVRDPVTQSTTIYDRWAAQTPDGIPRVDSPSEGGEHDSFLATATPSTAMRFSGPFGVYHSAYDTLLYATRLTDPDFAVHRAAAQLYGIVALRLADAATVPYTFSGYAPLLRGTVARLAGYATQTRQPFHTTRLSRAIARFRAVAANFDRSPTGRNDGDAARSTLSAARGLDELVYGVADDTSPTVAAIGAALAAHDAVLIDGAIGRDVAAIDRATDALARNR